MRNEQGHRNGVVGPAQQLGAYSPEGPRRVLKGVRQGQAEGRLAPRGDWADSVLLPDVVGVTLRRCLGVPVGVPMGVPVGAPVGVFILVALVGIEFRNGLPRTE